MAEVRYVAAAKKFLDALPAKFRAAIAADIDRVADLGIEAPVSLRTITGYSPMWEIRNGDYRTFFFIERGVMWILNACKKQDQKRAIRLAADRMKALRGR